MRRFIRSSLAFSLFAVIGCADEGTHQQESHVRLSGAIFTTTSDGSTVNGNNYDALCDVYLNGGPGPDGSAGLPAGDYYFQVTDPSGSVLLSTDDVTARMVTVDDTGRFVSASDHEMSMNIVDGGATVQLCPMLATPNPGCVYKVWLTPVGDYDLTMQNANFGFFEAFSKTDNFRVCPDDIEPPPIDEPPTPPMPPDAGPGDDHECPDGGMGDWEE